VPINIEIDNFYHSEPLSEIKGAIYNFKDLLRETILLEVPSFAECEGNCPRRQEVSKYLKEPSDDQQDSEDGYQPFADLDWKE
jgi:cytochrome oxidase Cu insertion factor (SCO1/SenC/PrrC family)